MHWERMNYRRAFMYCMAFAATTHPVFKSAILGAVSKSHQSEERLSGSGGQYATDKPEIHIRTRLTRCFAFLGVGLSHAGLGDCC